MDCGRIRDGLLNFIGEEVKVSRFARRCTITLPMRTLDGRYLDVHVEEVEDSRDVVVHDGGRTASELYAQGIHLTDSKRAVFRALAERHGARFDDRDDTFKTAIRAGEMQEAILAIAQCSSLAMHDVLFHKPIAGSVRVPKMVRRVLEAWPTSEFFVFHDFPLEGVVGGRRSQVRSCSDPIK